MFFWTFYQSKNTEKTNIVRSTTIFNIDNSKKCFLSIKSAYKNDFWRIMWQ